MPAILYRIELNPLTKPASYKLRFIPQGTAGYDEVAARVALKNPGASVEQIKNHLRSAMEEIQQLLVEGMQVTLEDALTFQPALRGRLPTADAPIPPIDEVLHISVSATRPFVKAIRSVAVLELLMQGEKVPSLLSAADTTTGLNNVLNPDGVLRLRGSNLFFEWENPDNGCVLIGTESGSTMQSQFADITDREILLVPHVPAQSNPWNNEYTVSVTTQYTEHGSLRTGTYGRKLRTPLAVPGLGLPSPPETGILTGSAATPYVGVNAGTLTADERLRIQVEHNLEDDLLAFRLIDMQDGGAEGAMVPVVANGEYILPGFSGSAVSSLEITVNDYAALKTMVLNDYDGRLVDILDVTMA